VEQFKPCSVCKHMSFDKFVPRVALPLARLAMILLQCTLAIFCHPGMWLSKAGLRSFRRCTGGDMPAAPLFLFFICLSSSGAQAPESQRPSKPSLIAVSEGQQRLVTMPHSRSAASEVGNKDLTFDHAPDANGPLLLDVKEHNDVPHVFKTAKSFGLTITNLTDTAVTIQRGIAIEGRTPKGWKKETGIQAVASCNEHGYQQNLKSPIRLSGHSSLAVYPWDGFLCGGQCEMACMQNTFAGPGIFRFVVVLIPDGKRILSNPFALQKP
jgi:hypothetical protein